MNKKSALLLLTLVALPSLAHAHTGHADSSGFTHGFTHPINGLDHILVMIAIGLWAAQSGGRALWAVPATFVGVMALGGALGVAGVTVPFVEPGIVASVLLLGLLIAFAVRLPLAASLPIVGLFAIFHGCAHGIEMPLNASGFNYGLGFVLATAGLHAIGIGLGLATARFATVPFVRLAGGAIAAVGIALFVI